MRIWVIFLAAMIGAGASVERVAAATGELAIELNRLESVEGACRASFVIRNDLGVPLAKLGMEIVLFDKQERVMTLLAINAGALAKTKTRLKQFDLKTIDCAAIGSLLLNDITSCDGDGQTPAGCLEKAKLTHKTAVPFKQ